MSRSNAILSEKSFAPRNVSEDEFPPLLEEHKIRFRKRLHSEKSVYSESESGRDSSLPSGIGIISCLIGHIIKFKGKQSSAIKHYWSKEEVTNDVA